MQAKRSLHAGSHALSKYGVEISYLNSAEIRRANLATLIAEAGSQRALSDLTGLAPAQISQWATAAPNSRTRTPRNISDDSARMLEAKMSRPAGWMDHDHSQVPSAPIPAIRSDPSLSLDQAIDLLVGLLDAADEASRERVSQRLQTLAKAPDSRKARDALRAELLNVSPLGKARTDQEGRTPPKAASA